MAKIELILDRADARYTPGETISGKATLTLDKQVKYRKITASLHGAESTQITTGTGKNRHTVTEENKLVTQELILKEESGKKEGVMSAGVFEFPFSFVLPENLPSSYLGNSVLICYELKAWVDVPMWFDLKCRKEIVVMKRSEGQTSSGISVSSETLNTQKPSFSIILNQSVFQAGQSLQGKITVFNPQNSSITKATIKISAAEHAKAQHSTAVAHICAAECNIPATELVYGLPKEFFIQIPPNAPATYASKLSGIEWTIEANLDLPWKFDVSAQSAITILKNPQPQAGQ